MRAEDPIPQIQKRDGRIVPFDPKKIEKAIEKAIRATSNQEAKAAGLAALVVAIAQKRFCQVFPTVEDIQDIVEEVLIKEGYGKVAKAYILYRQKRTEDREAKALLGVKDDLKLALNSLKVLQRRYLLRNEKGETVETPSQLFRRVAQSIAQVDKSFAGENEAKKTEKEFYQAMTKLEFLPNTPCLMNAGTDLGQLSACFVIPVFDSLKDIFEAVKHMTLIQQSGGGTGFDFSKLRPKGDVVKSTHGVASGPVSFIRVFDQATDVVKQGGKRRGANMGILRVDHPDIVEFITAKEKEGFLTNFNLSLAVTDKFMEKVEKNEEYELVNPRNGKVSGKLPAKWVFDLITTSAWRTGDPGLVFIDEINRANPTPELGRIESTNPCIVGDALISTEHGLLPMAGITQSYAQGGLGVITDNRLESSIYLQANTGKGVTSVLHEYGTSINVINRAFESGLQDTIKVITKSGYEITVTPEHKIKTTEGWVEAKDLKPARHRVLIQSGEGEFNKNKKLPFARKDLVGKQRRKHSLNLPSSWSEELGTVLGWLVADGWLKSGDKNCRVRFVFGKDDLEALHILKPILNGWYNRDITEVERSGSVYHLSYHSKYFVEFFERLGVKSVKAIKKSVPESIFTAPKNAVIGFLRGIFTANGTVNYRMGQSPYVRLTAKSEILLKEVQLLLLNLGIKSRIYWRRKPRGTFRYITASGEEKTNLSDGALFELEISKKPVLDFLDKIGFMGDKNRSKIDKFYKKSFYNLPFTDEVEKIIPQGKHRVFDLTEPKTHSFIANGMVISNCGEQPLLAYEPCNLGSINLSKMVKAGEIDWEHLRKTVHLAVHFLDNVVDVSKFPLPEITKMAQGNRKIGLGVMGWADLLLKLGIPYNSNEALKLAAQTMGFIEKEARKKSLQLAEIRGSFFNFKGSVWEKRGEVGMRNATVTTIAPTGTISIIANCSSGIEPLFAISFIRQVMEGTQLLETNPTFEEIARKRGFYRKELMLKISKYGSVQKIAEVPEDVRKVFVTALDIEPEWHVKMQSAFQKHVENATSKTVNLPEDATPEDVKKIYWLAYRLKCKGITIYRYGSKKEQVLYLTPPEKVLGVEAIRAESEFSGGCPGVECAY